jgi:hypothetical protein
MTICSIILLITLPLLMLEAKLMNSNWFTRKFGETRGQRIDLIAAGFVRTIAGTAFLIIMILCVQTGRFEGVRITATRAESPLWFWSIVVVCLPSAIGFTIWGLADLTKGIRDR